MTPTLFLFLAFQVTGVVSDPTGRPVPDAQIACGTETTTTNSQGEFHLAQPCEAMISKPGFASEKVAVTGSTTNAITLALASTSDRVVVTATGTAVALEEAGAAATVFTAPDFQPPHVPFVADLLRDVPGLNVVQTGQNGALTSVFVRGGAYNSAMVLLDGVPLTEPGGALDFVHLTSAGLDRMEVIRGPESAVFGGEASSGVIQMFTHRGDPEATVPHGSLLYERGSFSTDHWAASIDGGLIHRFDYAFTTDQFRSTGEFPNDAYRITSGTANLGFRISDKTQVRAVFREFDSYSGDPGQVAYGLVNYDATETARDSALSVRLDDARSKRFVQRVLVGYHRYRDRFFDYNSEIYDVAAILRTVPGSRSPYTYLVALANPSNPTAPPGTFFVDSPQTLYASAGLTVTDRANVSYQGTLTHHGGMLVFGYEYERQAGIISQTNVARYENGFFLTEQYALTRSVFLSAGARVQQSSTFGAEFTPRGAVTFRLPTNTYLRLSAARGIQEPALIENFARESFYVGNLSLKPETTDSFEAGLSHDWWSRRVRTELSYFRNSFRDLIEFDFSKNPATWINIDRSWARGVEVSGAARLTGFATLRAAYTKLYTRITRDSDPTQIGLELARRPRNSGSISLHLSARGWTFDAGARFVGERQESDFVFFAINRNPRYTYVFADASWRAAPHVSPFVRIGNALNQNYQEVLGYSALSRNISGGLKMVW